MFKKISNLFVRYRKPIILFVFFVIFLLILNDIFSEEIISYDEWAHNVLVKNLRSDWLTMIMTIITDFGSGVVLVPLSLLIFLLSKNKSKGICASLNLIIITIINMILKFIIQRPRPSGFNIIYESGYSFPSGHSMVSTAFYGFLIYLVYKNIKNKKLKVFLCALLFFLIIMICISRIYLGVHYASDVIGGFCISISYLMVFIMIAPKFLNIIDKES